jgi:phosphoesterase RecJ-like protein
VKNKFLPVIKVIEEVTEIIIATHIQPDGDGLGSLLGLASALKKMGKKIFATWGEKIVISPQYAWLPNVELIANPRDCPDYSVFIALDCATFERLGILEKCARRARVLINIDHHVDNTLYGSLNIIDESASATSQLVFELIKQLPIKIDKAIATCLYTGLVTDTGRFQYQNVNEKTFMIAKELLEYTVSPSDIFRSVYENISYSALKLLGLTLTKASFIPEIGFIYTVISQADLSLTGAGLEETENFIDYLRSVQEADVAAVLKENESGLIRVSLRSKGNIDVETIASKGGGGGHKNAAGYTSSKSLVETIEWLIKEVRAQVKQVRSRE